MLNEWRWYKNYSLPIVRLLQYVFFILFCLFLFVCWYMYTCLWWHVHKYPYEGQRRTLDSSGYPYHFLTQSLNICVLQNPRQDWWSTNLQGSPVYSPYIIGKKGIQYTETCQGFVFWREMVFEIWIQILMLLCTLQP